MRMTRQKSFNRFYQHFVVEDNPTCMSGDGVCRYRLEPDAHWEPGDKGCAIGIQPEFQKVYHKGFESVGIVTLWNSQTAVRDLIRKEDLNFFESLQMLHDNRRAMPDFETFFIPKFIKEWRLNTPKRRKGKANDEKSET